MTHRFFVASESISAAGVTLENDTARQLTSVLRMRPGDEIDLLDNTGQLYRVRLTKLSRHKVTGQIIAQHHAGTEPAVHLTLYQGTLKSKNFEL